MNGLFRAALCVLMAVVPAASAKSAEWKLCESDKLIECFAQDFGKPQRNKPVGGNSFSVGNVAFQEGIGTHAYSQTYVILDGRAEAITGQVGVDDCTRGKGSVFFFLLDAQTHAVLWQSKLMLGGDKPVPFNVPLTGIRHLALRVTDGGDGIKSDSADWLDVRIRYSGQKPELAGAIPPEPADDRTWKLHRVPLNTFKQGFGRPQRDKGVGSGHLSVAGIRYREGIGTHANGEARIGLDGRAEYIAGLVGVDGAARDKGSVFFKVVDEGNNRVLWDSGLMRGNEKAKAFRIPLGGVQKLLLQVTDAGDGKSSDHADWIDVRIRYAGTEPSAVVP